MVKCTDPSCGVWQHRECVGEAADVATYLCERCRAQLADPFWKPVEDLLPAARLKPVVGRPPVMDQYHVPQTQQALDRAVHLSDAQLLPMKSDPASHRVQLGCILLEDSVPVRYHWPRNVTLRVNTMQCRAYSRSATTKMGINQRDDAVNCSALCLRGRNSIDITAIENGTWVLFTQLATKRTLEQVKAMMLAQESFEAATQRVRDSLHGGDGGIVVAQVVVSLKDPMSGQRMAVPARFTDASGLQAFDLDSFLSIAERNRKWQDPTTLKNSSVRHLQVDTFTQQVLQALADFPHITDVEISNEGQWRPDGWGDTWFSITQAIGEVQEAIAAAGGGNAAVEARRRSTGGAGPSVEEGILVDDSETDEEEELRRAAAAVKPAAAALAGQKRKAPEPIVIDLVDSSDDETEARGAPARVVSPRQQHHDQQVQRMSALREAAASHMDSSRNGQAASPLRIRLGRPQPPPRQAPAPAPAPVPAPGRPPAPGTGPSSRPASPGYTMSRPRPTGRHAQPMPPRPAVQPPQAWISPPPGPRGPINYMPSIPGVAPPIFDPVAMAAQFSQQQMRAGPGQVQYAGGAPPVRPLPGAAVFPPPASQNGVSGSGGSQRGGGDSQSFWESQPGGSQHQSKAAQEAIQQEIRFLADNPSVVAELDDLDVDSWFA